MNWFKQAANAADMTEDEFINYHRKGYIDPEAYQNYRTREGIAWLGDRDSKPVLHSKKDFGNMPIEFRQSGEKNKYVKVDDEDEIVRDEEGMVTYLTDEEVIAKGKSLYDESIVAYDDQGPVGWVANEWGVPGVWVIDEMQGRGIGTYLLSQWMKGKPEDQRLGQMTPAGENMSRSYYRQLVEESGEAR
tara:strand:+ start:1818 stop:2384 length:567 start_codon:yes stop_codon:yes gene_type:complete